MVPKSTTLVFAERGRGLALTAAAAPVGGFAQAWFEELVAGCGPGLEVEVTDPDTGGERRPLGLAVSDHPASGRDSAHRSRRCRRPSPAGAAVSSLVPVLPALPSRWPPALPLTRTHHGLSLLSLAMCGKLDVNQIVARNFHRRFRVFCARSPRGAHAATHSRTSRSVTSRSSEPWKPSLTSPSVARKYYATNSAVDVLMCNRAERNLVVAVELVRADARSRSRRA